MKNVKILKIYLLNLSQIYNVVVTRLNSHKATHDLATRSTLPIIIYISHHLKLPPTQAKSGLCVTPDRINLGVIQ